MKHPSARSTLPGFTAEMVIASAPQCHAGRSLARSRQASELLSPAYIDCGNHVCTCTGLDSCIQMFEGPFCTGGHAGCVTDQTGLTCGCDY